MKRIHLAFLAGLAVTSTAYPQSNEELLEAIRANAAKIYVEQASITLPESFFSSGLSLSDKDRLVEEWAEQSATCHVEALSDYANSSDIPLSDLINEDGTYGFGVGVPADWEVQLESCLSRSWETIGATLPE